jgi:hypothetical protein
VAEQQMAGERAHIIISGDHLDRSLGMIGDQLDNLRGDVRIMSETMPEAMAAALRNVLTDQSVIDNLIGKVATTAQRRAAEKTGNAVAGFILSLLTRWLVIGFILLMVAKTAGMDLAGKVWAAMKGAA